MAEVYKNILFSKQDRNSDHFGLMSPRHSENILAEMCYLYRRTRQKHCRRASAVAGAVAKTFTKIWHLKIAVVAGW